MRPKRRDFWANFRSLLGANIGLATVFFGIRYPEARILAVEPEEANFAALASNTAALGDRVKKYHAAVWVKDGVANLHTEDPGGISLGAWGVQVSDNLARAGKTTPCYRLATLLGNAGFSSVDILKVDIEGAERELFSYAVADWLPRIKLIIIETHDRFRPGSEATVRKAISPMFREQPKWGENLIFRRTQD